VIIGFFAPLKVHHDLGDSEVVLSGQNNSAGIFKSVIVPTVGSVGLCEVDFDSIESPAIVPSM